MKNIKDKFLYQALGFAILSAVILMSSCVEKDTWNLDNIDESVNMEVKLAAPLALGSIDVNEAINDWSLDTVEFKHYDNGLLYFDYLSEFEIMEFVEVDIPDQDTAVFFTSNDLLEKFNVTLPFPLDNVVIPVGKTVVDTIDLIFDMKIEGGEIYSARFKSGIFEIQGGTGFKDMAGIEESYTVVVPELKFDGVPYKTQLTSEQLFQGNLLNLDGSTMGFARDEDAKIVIKVVYEVNNTTSALILPSSDMSNIGFSIRLQSMKPSYIEGYLDASQTFEQSEEVKIPILSPDYVQDSTIFFYDPQVELYLENWVGVPFSMELKKLMVINTETKDSVDLKYERSVVNIAPATCTMLDDNYNIAPAYVDEIINRENSEIEKILNKVYNKAYVSYCLSPNPEGKTGVDNFLKVEESKQMKLIAHTILPIYLKIDNYRLSDTIDFDFKAEVIDEMEDDTATLNSLDSLVLFLNVESRIPAELKAQVYFADAKDQIVDSLFIDGSNVIIGAAPVDAEGVATGSTHSEMRVVYSGEKLDLWEAGKKIIFKVNANSTDITYVKAFVDQGLDYSLGVYTKATIDDELLD